MRAQISASLILWARSDDWRNYLIQFLAGASLIFAYAPFGIWLVVIPALVILCLALPSLTAKQSFKHGLAFGLGYFGAGMSWVHISIYEFGHTGLFLSVLFTFAFVALLALFPALACWLLNRYFAERIKWVYWLLAWPFCWLFLEWIRSWLFTGLPWLNIGHSQVNGPLAEMMPVLGSDGAALWLLLMIGLIAYWFHTSAWRLVAVSIVLQAGLYLFLQQQTWVSPSGDTVKVTMLQPNVPQDKKWEAVYRMSAMRHLFDTTDGLDDQLVIWPEAAVPALAYQVLDYLEAVDALAESQSQTVLTGIPVQIGEDYYNAVRLLGQDSGEYHKRHLVPFGEYVPFEKQLRGLIAFFDMPMSSFSKGAFEQPRLQIGEHQVALAICYEIIFQSLVAQQVEGSDYLVTLSNDAWFGESHGPHQHLELARIRALEYGIPVIRSTNDGISAFIDADGHLIKTLGKGIRGSLSHELVLYQGTTPYRALGPEIVLLLIFAPLVVGLLLFRSKRQA
jgi:apolipoprotein N-acyltransferase